MAIEELEGKDTNVSSRKGVFIPDITVEMFRNASLEGVEELMASGKMEDISLPSAQPERPKGEWITDDLSGIISCSRCGNAAPMETTGGRQYKSKFCQTCGADMRGGQDVIKYMADDAQYFVDVEEALNMATNVLTAQPETHDKRTETHARDCISRQATIDAYGDWYVEEGTADGFIGTVKQLLEGLPPAQPEIICCKDCKHRPTIKDGFIVLTEETMKCPCDGGDYIHSWIPEDNFYCANAERREECFTDVRDAVES